MKMNRTHIIIALFVVAAVLILAVIFSTLPAPTPTGGARLSVQQGTATPLPAAEIRQYEGKDLSSVNDFRENSIKGPQHVNISDYRLTVSGLVTTPKVYTYDELLRRFPHYSKVVTLFCVEGWDATILWEGIRVRDIIADSGEDPKATTVIFRAYDGYSTSLPLAYLIDRDIILAYRMNNVTLPAERGYPFQLVAEDKWGYKWIKWVTGIELTQNTSYRGYWEQRGYSNTADLDKNFFAD
jgi:DMSO/TMAO reductase YedYZ molybdopterin-dependent catalytic subunit